MLNSPLNFFVDQPDHNIAPKLTNEFPEWYILALAARERAERWNRVRHRLLSRLGLWVVKLGLHIKHASQPQMTLRHMYVRNVSHHYYRTHRRK